jgi:hypothetical protein
MNRAAEAQPFATPRTPLALFRPPGSESSLARWRINGHLAVIVVWTDEEWSRLPERPDDAQYYPCGVWCALRLL